MLRKIIYTLLGLAGFAIVIFSGLLVATRTAPVVPLTVLEDPSLPRLQGDGVTLHGRVVGAEDAPLVIVLHGGPGNDHRSLLALEALAETHRVLFYDQRGAGLSERVTAERLGIGGHLADIDRLIEVHSPDTPVTLLGHSMGATLALAYLGHAPDRVGKAVLIEPGFLDAAGYDAFEARRVRIANSPRVIWAGVMAGFRSRGVTGDGHAAQDSIIGTAVFAFANHPDNPYHCGQGYTAPGWRFGGLASQTFWADVTPTLAAVAPGLAFDGPVLFVSGSCNTWIGPDLQAQHAARLSQAEVAQIDGAGHDVVWDQPEKSVAVIQSFLDR